MADDKGLGFPAQERSHSSAGCPILVVLHAPSPAAFWTESQVQLTANVSIQCFPNRGFTNGLREGWQMIEGFGRIKPLYAKAVTGVA